MTQINVDDVKEAIIEMLNQYQIVNKDSICVYMGIEPIVKIPPAEEGGIPKYIYNNQFVYGCINRLRWQCIGWRNKRKKYLTEEGKIEFEKAAKWDPQSRELIKHSAIMTHETFVDKRMASENIPEGLFLIPVRMKYGRKHITTHIIPNPSEERSWGIRISKKMIKGLGTTLKRGHDMEHFELSDETRQFLGKLRSGAFLKSKKIETKEDAKKFYEEEIDEEEIEEENKDEQPV